MPHKSKKKHSHPHICYQPRSRFSMFRWTSPFSSFYENLPDVFISKYRQDDKANRSWTFAESSPVKVEKNWPPSGKPATPIPRKKVSTPLRIRRNSQNNDDKFDYLAKRVFPTDARSSISAVPLLSKAEVKDDTLSFVHAWPSRPMPD